MPGPVLVANRGEIAVRIVRACRELGRRSVVVVSDADADGLAARTADVAARIGPAPARASYLDVDAVVAAGRAHGATAVHPGYGLLSEDAGFAAAVTAAGMTFVGPPAAVIAELGDKVRARALARRCGVPVLDGTDGPVDPDDPAVPGAAAGLGFPLLVKAAHGGGGRGMRVVSDPDGLAGALGAAGREAAAAFGRGEVFLERLAVRPRHVEVQVLADHHGAVAVLGDRDCTVQRRHQKLLEEAPAPDLPDDLRVTLHSAARRLARTVGYRGAGTVEFLLDRATDPPAPAFLEMNTRLQVEHGVTEMVTGVDLVVAQLRIADGEPLAAVLPGVAPGDADPEVPVRGHAVQARIAAEDPAAAFRPAPGRLTGLVLPAGPWVRCDLGVAAGDAVPGEYDSLLGKVHAWGPDRATACRRLGAALADLDVRGVPTTSHYLRGVLARPDHGAMRHDTGSVERDWAPEPAATTPTEPGTPSPGPDAGLRRIRLATDRGTVTVVVPSRPRPGSSPIARRDARSPGRPTGAAPRAGTNGTAGPDASPGTVTAPMDATVVSVEASPGTDVDAGAVLVVLEAMKMELPVRSGTAGRVGAVHVAPGDAVRAGTPLVDVD